jgi:hypothetical protein
MNDIIIQQNIILIKESYHNYAIPKKRLRSTTFNNKIYTYIKETVKKSFPSKFSIFFKVVEFRPNDFKMFINTLWYDNVHDYDFFRLKSVFPLKIYLG